MTCGKIYDFPPRGKIYLEPFFASKDVMGKWAVFLVRLKSWGWGSFLFFQKCCPQDETLMQMLPHMSDQEQLQHQRGHLKHLSRLRFFFSEKTEGRQQKGETGPGTHIFADVCRFSLIFGSVNQGIWEL